MSRAEKYIDLADPIINEDTRRGVAGVYAALTWLDSHPDQVPGRTITESEFHETADAHRNGGLGWEDLASRFGITVTPDPEPTNAEKLEAHLLDLLGVVEAIGNTGVHNMAYELDRAGVKAPGGDDE